MKKMGLDEFSKWLLEAVVRQLEYGTNNIRYLFLTAGTCLPDEIAAIRSDCEKCIGNKHYHREVMKYLFGEMGELVCDRLNIGVIRDVPHPSAMPAPKYKRISLADYDPYKPMSMGDFRAALRGEMEAYSRDCRDQIRLFFCNLGYRMPEEIRAIQDKYEGTFGGFWRKVIMHCFGEEGYQWCEKERLLG